MCREPNRPILRSCPDSSGCRVRIKLDITRVVTCVVACPDSVNHGFENRNRVVGYAIRLRCLPRAWLSSAATRPKSVLTLGLGAAHQEMESAMTVLREPQRIK